MAETDSFEWEVLKGFGLAAAAAIPILYFDPTGSTPTPPGKVGIYVDLLPPTITEPAVVLRDYTVLDDASDGNTVQGVQVEILHEDRLVHRAIRGQLFNTFHGRWGGNLGTVQLIQASRTSGTNNGQDSNGRLSRYENYYLGVDRPAPNRH